MSKNKKVVKKAEEVKEEKKDIKVTAKEEKEKNTKSGAKKQENKKQGNNKKENKVQTEEKKIKNNEDKSVDKNKAEENVEVKALEKKLKRPNTEKIVIASIIVVALVLAFGLFGYYYYNTNAKPVATFDGGTVTTADFNLYYKLYAQTLQYYGYSSSSIPEVIANQAGIDKIMLKAAKEANVTLSDEDKSKIDEMFADEDKVQQFVDEGIDVARVKQLYYDIYTISAYTDKLIEDANDDDVIAYIKETYGDDVDLYEYNTSHILFKTVDDNGSDLSDEEQAQAKSNAEAALARALAGEDFATLAKELSEDTGTKEDGGQYTMYMDGNTYTEYADAVKTLEVGGITTTLVKTDAGYHIIKLNEKIENGRAHNDAEREDFVYKDIDNIGTTKNLEIDTDYLEKLVEKLTGESADDEEDTTTDSTTDSTTTDNTTTDSTTTDDSSSTTDTTTESAE